MFILHIHLSTKPGKCFWLRALDGTLTPHAELAHEFQNGQEAEATQALMLVIDQSGMVDGLCEAAMHHTPAIPPKIATLFKFADP